MEQVLIEIIAAAGSTLAFGIIFNLKGKKLVFSRKQAFSHSFAEISGIKLLTF